MKTSALTIRLDPELERRLAEAAERSGRSRSEFVREALRRQLALTQFEDLRRRIMPFAEAQGLLSDEEIFREISRGSSSTRTSWSRPSPPEASAPTSSIWSSPRTSWFSAHRFWGSRRGPWGRSSRSRPR